MLRKRGVLAGVLAVLAVAGVGSASPATPAAKEGPPIVLVVFDALPPLLLQDDQRRIDPVRFPNFAAFARGATWYRNATTIHESTRFSVPSIFDGRRPRPGQRENYVDHPYTIFSLLRGRYRMNVWQEATDLCPPGVCARRGGGNVIKRLTTGRDKRFRAAVRRITRGAKPQLTVIHALLPHEPRQYLPDGRRYQLAGTPDPAIDGAASYHRRFLQEQSLQRTLLQLEFTDSLVKRLVDRLKSQGIYDDTLIAFVSDHGESFDTKKMRAAPFRVGELSFRRAVTPRNIEDIAGIAMFVKYPGQDDGRIDDRFVRHVDVFPTLANAAGVRAAPGLAGQDLRNAGYRGHPDVAVQKQDGRVVSLPAARWRARVDASKAHELSLFGSGDHSLFAFGPAQRLYGRAPGELRLRRLPVALYRSQELQRVRLRGRFLPIHVIGRAKRPVAGRTLAFALNGTIVASAPGYPTSGKRTRFNFSVLLPPDAFVEGRNRLEVYEL